MESPRKSWSKRTEAMVTTEQTKERTHHVTFLNLYIDSLTLALCTFEYARVCVRVCVFVCMCVLPAIYVAHCSPIARQSCFWNRPGVEISMTSPTPGKEYPNLKLRKIHEPKIYLILKCIDVPFSTRAISQRYLPIPR